MTKPLPQELLGQFKKYLSPYVLDLLHYAKNLFVVRVGESENVEMPEKADFRV